jgi:hypothetical protein
LLEIQTRLAKLKVKVAASVSAFLRNLVACVVGMATALKVVYLTATLCQLGRGQRVYQQRLPDLRIEAVIGNAIPSCS